MEIIFDNSLIVFIRKHCVLDIMRATYEFIEIKCILKIKVVKMKVQLYLKTTS